MHNQLCQVCLRTDVTVKDLSTELFDFLDELCDFNCFVNARMKFCSICQHLLKKFYNFREKCRKANKLIKSLKNLKTQEFPTTLHLKLPSTLGMCNSLATYTLIELKHSDLISDPGLENTPFLLIEPQRPQNDLELKIETEPLDHISFDPIDVPEVEVKSEDEDNTPTHNNMDIASDFELINTLEPDNTKRSEVTEGTNDNSNSDEQIGTHSEDNVEESTMNTYAREFSKNLKTNQDSDANGNKDTQLEKDNDSLSDINDDVKSDFDSDSDANLETISKSLHEKHKDVDVKESYDLAFAEELLNVDRKDKELKIRVKFLKLKIKAKGMIVNAMENDQLDLGDGLKINKDVFLKIFERCDVHSLKKIFDSSGALDTPKLTAFLRRLMKLYNPDYETVFRIEYLDSEEKKLQEFNRRKESPAYTDAAFKCDVCFKGFEFESFQKYHIRTHVERPNDASCHICSMRFAKNRHSGHMKTHHSAVFTCMLCQLVTYHFAVMVNHYNQHKGVEYQCPTCSGVFSNKTTLENHRRSHVTSHVCSACARSFISEKGLLWHRQQKHKDAVVRPEDAATCKKCNITFDSCEVLEKHHKMMHRYPEKLYKCQLCRQGFNSIEALRRHRQDAGHERAPRAKPATSAAGRRVAPKGEAKTHRTCPVCQEEVVNTVGVSLYKHFVSRHPGVPYHADEMMSKDFLCEQCGKTFHVESVYRDHKNSHTGAKPYTCALCPAAFRSRNLLTIHAERHGPPRHRCQHCPSRFKSSANLYAHTRFHVGDRRYKCDICGKGFLHRISLNEHVRGVHLRLRRARRPPASRRPAATGEDHVRARPTGRPRELLEQYPREAHENC